MDQIRKIKATILSESRGDEPAPEQMVQLAVNEAEALSWQTRYPHLVFPMLAVEKVQAVKEWNRRQQAIWRVEPMLAAA